MGRGLQRPRLESPSAGSAMGQRPNVMDLPAGHAQAPGIPHSKSLHALAERNRAANHVFAHKVALAPRHLEKIGIFAAKARFRGVPHGFTHHWRKSAVVVPALGLLHEDGSRPLYAPAGGRATGGGTVAELVVLRPYDSRWPDRFEQEAARLRLALPGLPIEHVGSTSVPGMLAKPFIDMVARVADENRLQQAIPLFESLSYRYVPEAERVVPNRRFFRRLDLDPGYHLHLVPKSAPLWSNLLKFRDALRSDAALAREYMALKRNLAEVHAGDVEAYTEAKGPSIEAWLRSLEIMSTQSAT